VFDTTVYLYDHETQPYQSLIGANQWAISIGCFDLGSAVMTLSSFCAMPLHGHMESAQRIYGYLSKMSYAVICVRTDQPELSGLSDQVFYWLISVYGEVKELFDDNIPLPLGKPITLFHYFVANLYHDLITGHSTIGIYHPLNKTPIERYSMKQSAIVETATYGSEFIATRTCVDQIIDQRSYHRYLGVPINEWR
jgi:hypothetical protein